jgi:hypothetical protein
MQLKYILFGLALAWGKPTQGPANTTSTIKKKFAEF